jgi:putative zinc finger/helix-turn-helix YgiT family protein
MICEKCKTEMEKINIDYHYKESGLDNINIGNIFAYRCPTCKELHPIIPNIKGLHEKIAEIIANKKSILIGKELVFLRKELRLKAKDLANMMGVSKVTVSRWENKKGPISVACDRFIRLFYRNRILQSKCEIVKPEMARLKLSAPTEELSYFEGFIALCDWISKTEINLKDIKKRPVKSQISIPAYQSLGPLFT